ncbi:MAG: hypothetical protein WC707_01090 [Candidatus Babeliaceae bacterium]
MRLYNLWPIFMLVGAARLIAMDECVVKLKTDKREYCISRALLEKSQVFKNMAKDFSGILPQEIDLGYAGYSDSEIATLVALLQGTKSISSSVLLQQRINQAEVLDKFEVKGLLCNACQNIVDYNNNFHNCTFSSAGLEKRIAQMLYAQYKNKIIHELQNQIMRSAKVLSPCGVMAKIWGNKIPRTMRVVGDELVVCGKNCLYVMDVVTGSIVRSNTKVGDVHAFVITRDLQKLIAQVNSGELCIYNFVTLQFLEKIECERAWLYKSMNISYDGSKLICPGIVSKNTIQLNIVDLETKLPCECKHPFLRLNTSYTDYYKLKHGDEGIDKFGEAANILALSMDKSRALVHLVHEKALAIQDGAYNEEGIDIVCKSPYSSMACGRYFVIYNKIRSFSSDITVIDLYNMDCFSLKNSNSIDFKYVKHIAGTVEGKALFLLMKNKNIYALNMAPLLKVGNYAVSDLLKYVHA